MQQTLILRTVSEPHRQHINKSTHQSTQQQQVLNYHLWSNNPSLTRSNIKVVLRQPSTQKSCLRISGSRQQNQQPATTEGRVRVDVPRWAKSKISQPRLWNQPINPESGSLLKLTLDPPFKTHKTIYNGGFFPYVTPT